jgi:hypothetical protein
MTKAGPHPPPRARHLDLNVEGRDPRAAIVVDDEVPPFAFVHIRGHVTLSEDLEELLRFATAIGGRYMGADRAEEFGRRNAVPGELLVRLRPERLIAAADVAGD